MKKSKWVNEDKMLFESGHKTFDKQTNIIASGSMIANTMVGWHIRPYNEVINPVGDLKEPGYLQNFDLGVFADLPGYIRTRVEKCLIDRGGYLYKFFHHNGNNLIIHGWILTYSNHDLIRCWIMGPTTKSAYIIQEAIKYVSNAN